MKKMFVLISAMFCVSVLMAQSSGKPQNLMAQEIQLGDSVLMKEGSVWLIKDGKRTVVERDVVIGGTMVKADGTVIFKDRTTTTLQEGDVILWDGRLVRAIIKVRLDTPKEQQ